MQFTQGPGMFFTTFSSTGAPPPGPGPASAHDSDVIDVEVVEDDGEGPPELPAPG